MPDLGFDLQAWILVAVNLALGLAVPFVALRQLTRPRLLREQYVLSKPGRIMALGIAIIIMLGAFGVGVALGAITHPFLWALEAPVVGGIVATALYLARYRRVARMLERQRTQ